MVELRRFLKGCPGQNPSLIPSSPEKVAPNGNHPSFFHLKNWSKVGPAWKRHISKTNDQECKTVGQNDEEQEHLFCHRGSCAYSSGYDAHFNTHLDAHLGACSKPLGMGSFGGKPGGRQGEPGGAEEEEEEEVKKEEKEEEAARAAPGGRGRPALLSTEPSRAVSGRIAESSQTVPSRDGVSSAQAVPSRAKASCAEPCQAEPNQAAPSQSEPNQAAPRRAKLNQATPSQAELP